MDLIGRMCEQDEEFARLLRQEKLLVGVTEALLEAIDKIGMSRKELADRLGKTPGFVSQLLGGRRNLTLRTIADIAGVLSMVPALKLSPRHEVAREIIHDQRSLQPRILMKPLAWETSLVSVSESKYSYDAAA